MSAKIVIYTAIFGNYEGLIPQPKFTGVDYICFTDQPIKSTSWKVVEVPAQFENPVLNARQYKILPHRFLEEYEISVYIDGNFLILQNPEKLIENKLKEDNVLAFFDHNKADDARDCIYQEYEALLQLEKEKGYFKDDPQAMKRHIDFLRQEKYPENFGLISSGVLIRKHQDIKLKKLMEDWWYYVENYTNRDQLSFNYVLWKNNFKKYTFLDGDIRRGNGWFYFLGHHKKNYKFKLVKFKLKRFFRTIKL